MKKALKLQGLLSALGGTRTLPFLRKGSTARITS